MSFDPDVPYSDANYNLHPACFKYPEVLMEKMEVKTDMCTVGGGPDIGNIETLAAKDYECLECKNQFKGMGRRPMCPTCKSRNVKAL
jgi:Zn finger protein HypA/HybF involved in hydrogenase expression